jgi:hypothetical protein
VIREKKYILLGSGRARIFALTREKFSRRGVR